MLLLWVLLQPVKQVVVHRHYLLHRKSLFRLVVVVLMPDPAIHWAGFAAGLALIGYNNLVVGRRQAVDTG